MVDQTTVRPTQSNGSYNQVDSPITEGVIGNLGEFGGNIAGLVELQAQLAVADVKESVRQASVPIALIVTGAGLLISAIPVAMIGLSELLYEFLRLPNRGLAYLIVAGGATALSAILILLGVPRFTRSFAILVRSKEELARNVAWIKTVLANSGRRPAHRRK